MSTTFAQCSSYGAEIEIDLQVDTRHIKKLESSGLKTSAHQHMGTHECVASVLLE